MKVLFYLAAYAGGASRSALQYMKSLNQLNIDSCVIANNGSSEGSFGNSYIYKGIAKDILFCENPTESFGKHNFIKYYFDICSLYNKIAKNDPDSVLCFAEMYMVSQICKLLKKGFIPIIPGGNFVFGEKEIRKWDAPCIICFSEENVEILKKANVPKGKIYKIPNRISCVEDYGWKEFYGKERKVVEFLFISRFVAGKINSAKKVIYTVRNLVEAGINVHLSIAGQGKQYEVIEKMAKEVNSSFEKEIITMLGFVKNVEEYVLKSDIVFGKGRSVIEPIMKNRIGVIVGEDYKMSLCTAENFGNLCSHNFAGRDIEKELTEKELYELCYRILNNELNYDELKRTFEIVRKVYSADFLTEKLAPIVKLYFGKKNERTKKKRWHYIILLWKVLVYIVLKIQQKLKRRA